MAPSAPGLELGAGGGLASTERWHTGTGGGHVRACTRYRLAACWLCEARDDIFEAHFMRGADRPPEAEAGIDLCMCAPTLAAGGKRKLMLDKRQCVLVLALRPRPNRE